MTLFQDMLSYKALLESFGARVSLFQSVELPCVLTSQLVRLLAFQKEFGVHLHDAFHRSKEQDMEIHALV